MSTLKEITIGYYEDREHTNEEKTFTCKAEDLLDAHNQLKAINKNSIIKWYAYSNEEDEE